MQRTLPNPSILPLGWRDFISHLILITTGTLIGTLSVLLFNVPAEIAPAGLSGVGVIVNALFGWPIGLVGLIGNLPILYLAYRMLGGLKAVIWITYAVVLYSVAVDILIIYLPAEGVSSGRLLNAIFAGIVGGMGAGLIYRAGGSFDT